MAQYVVRRKDGKFATAGYGYTKLLSKALVWDSKPSKDELKPGETAVEVELRLKEEP